MQKVKITVEKIAEIIRNEFDVPKSVVMLPGSSVSRGLGMDSDDISFDLVPALEKELGIRLSNSIWSKTETLQEIADAFQRQIDLSNEDYKAELKLINAEERTTRLRGNAILALCFTAIAILIYILYN